MKGDVIANYCNLRHKHSEWVVFLPETLAENDTFNNFIYTEEIYRSNSMQGFDCINDLNFHLEVFIKLCCDD